MRPLRSAVMALSVAAACATLRVSPAGAQVLSARVAVRGMTCNICSATVERRLRHVSCIVSASVDLEHGLARIAARDGEHFDGRRVLKAIRDAGFTPGDIEVVARGRLLSGDHPAYLDLGHGDVAILTAPPGAPALTDLPPPGSVIQVSGRFADPSGDAHASVGITVERTALVGAK